MIALRVLFLLILGCISPISNAAQLHALVIGNSHYEYSGTLANASNDALVIASKLRDLGFEVTEGIDQNRREMRSALRAFHQQLSNSPNSVALVFYAGHGIQRNGQNFLIPVDADITRPYEIEDTSINLNSILASMNEARPRLSIVMLDACRNNPFERNFRPATRTSFYQSSGLAAVEGLYGTILSYATEPGSVAVDGRGRHSPYTSAILQHIATPGLSIQEMLNQVGLSVMERTHGEQKPWVSSSPVPRFCFAGCNNYQRIASHSGSPRENRSSANIVGVKTAIRNQDLDTLKKLIFLESGQEHQLQQLFHHYPDILIEPTDTSRSLVINGSSKTIEMRVVEAKNEEGNRVIPGPHWQHFTFHLR